MKIDGVYDETLRARISADLESEVERLAAWWEEKFALGVPRRPIEPDPRDVEAFSVRKHDVLSRLLTELGDDYVIDPT